MDAFWTDVLGVADPLIKDRWASRGQNIEHKVREAVVQNGMPHDDDWDPMARALGQVPFRCLEIGTYCGYSALRIARNLPDNGTLLSVEKDPLFAAIATKIVEFAGLEKKVKVSLIASLFPTHGRFLLIIKQHAIAFALSSRCGWAP
jgi:hypothetical protein